MDEGTKNIILAVVLKFLILLLSPSFEGMKGHARHFLCMTVSRVFLLYLLYFHTFYRYVCSEI
jgi:hypothetical protein